MDRCEIRRHGQHLTLNFNKSADFSSARTTNRFPSARETQPQLHSALLRLSAIASQFFIRFREMDPMIMSVRFNCGFEFEKGRQLLIRMHFSVQRRCALRPRPKLVGLSSVLKTVSVAVMCIRFKNSCSEHFCCEQVLRNLAWLLIIREPK